MFDVSHDEKIPHKKTTPAFWRHVLLTWGYFGVTYVIDHFFSNFGLINVSYIVYHTSFNDDKLFFLLFCLFFYFFMDFIEYIACIIFGAFMEKID